MKKPPPGTWRVVAVSAPRASPTTKQPGRKRSAIGLAPALAPSRRSAMCRVSYEPQVNETYAEMAALRTAGLSRWQQQAAGSTLHLMHGHFSQLPSSALLKQFRDPIHKRAELARICQKIDNESYRTQDEKPVSHGQPLQGSLRSNIPSEPLKKRIEAVSCPRAQSNRRSMPAGSNVEITCGQNRGERLQPAPWEPRLGRINRFRTGRSARFSRWPALSGLGHG
jgi:hypothetical protein